MRLSLFTALIILIVSSCSNYESGSSLKAYLGDFGDAMVVCDQEFWDGTNGDSIKILFTEYLPATMPAQGQLDLEFSSPVNFKGSAKRFRNVLYLDIGDRVNNQTANIKTTKGEFANDQLIVYAYAKTEAEMMTLLSQRYKDILYKINDEEIKRKQAILSYRQDTSSVNRVRSKKGYDMIIPEKYTVLVDSGNVLWMNKLTSVMDNDLEKYTVKDIVVSTYDYDSEEIFELENLIKKRDEFLKPITFDEEDSTYVRFQEKLDPVKRTLRSEGNEYQVEIRSLWTKEGAFQGGPSIQFVQLDYKNRRVIHADARIYAPGNYKREMLREVEAIIKSITPVE